MSASDLTAGTDEENDMESITMVHDVTAIWFTGFFGVLALLAWSEAIYVIRGRK